MISLRASAEEQNSWIFSAAGAPAALGEACGLRRQSISGTLSLDAAIDFQGGTCRSWELKMESHQRSVLDLNLEQTFLQTDWQYEMRSHPVDQAASMVYRVELGFPQGCPLRGGPISAPIKTVRGKRFL